MRRSGKEPAVERATLAANVTDRLELNLFLTLTTSFPLALYSSTRDESSSTVAIASLKLSLEKLKCGSEMSRVDLRVSSWVSTAEFTVMAVLCEVRSWSKLESSSNALRSSCPSLVEVSNTTSTTAVDALVRDQVAARSRP